MPILPAGHRDQHCAVRTLSDILWQQQSLDSRLNSLHAHTKFTNFHSQQHLAQVMCLLGVGEHQQPAAVKNLLNTLQQHPLDNVDQLTDTPSLPILTAGSILLKSCSCLLQSQDIHLQLSNTSLIKFGSNIHWMVLTSIEAHTKFTHSHSWRRHAQIMLMLAAGQQASPAAVQHLQLSNASLPSF